MTADAPRYAIYFVPAPETALYTFGSDFIGYDSYSGADVENPNRLGFPVDDWTRLIAEPRRYGFHATLKAPFFLDPAYRESDLNEALAGVAASGLSPVVFRPSVRLLKSFVAIVPDGHSKAVTDLAATCVTAFDKFRAPMSQQERARRLRAGLTAVQISHLERWGYPYVFDEFRFHMTLTGTLPPANQADTETRLCQAFNTACNGPVQVDRIAILREDDRKSAFRVTAVATLRQNP